MTERATTEDHRDGRQNTRTTARVMNELMTRYVPCGRHGCAWSATHVAADDALVCRNHYLNEKRAGRSIADARRRLDAVRNR